ncbi:MAG: NfeD family protein [Clostridia bacterium]|nr:NfeD family protein [Clostridia bacterium]
MKETIEAALQRQKNRRRVLRLLICMLTLAALALSLYLASLAIGGRPQTLPVAQGLEVPDFSATELPPEYLEGYDRNVYFYKTASLGEIVTEESKELLGADVSLLYGMLMAMMRGDADSYNACFTAEYTDVYGKEDRFTAQKLYDIRLENKGVPDPQSGARCYRLTYCIYRNDGTLRADIGSDEIREQYLYVVDIEGGVAINNVAYNLGNQRTVWEASMLLYVWITVIAVAIIAEVLTAKRIAVWLLPAAALPLVLSLCHVDILWLQLLLFFLLFAVGVLIYKLILEKRFKKGGIPSYIDSVIGQTCTVTQRIDNLAGCGEVRVHGLYWAARACDEETVYEEGETVTVVAAEGVKLICK